MAQPVQTGTEAHGGNHGGGVFPPFDNATFANQLVWLALVFGALYLLMSRIALPRVEGILSKRNKVLQDDLDAAHAFKLETDTSISAYAKALDDAKKNAQQIAAKTSDDLKIQSDAKRREVDAALTARLAKAEAQITAQRQQAMAHVSEIAASATTDIVSHLTGRAPSAQDVTAAVAQAIKG
jgi:F-type H+-transporting ATPase subunit b